MTRRIMTTVLLLLAIPLAGCNGPIRDAAREAGVAGVEAAQRWYESGGGREKIEGLVQKGGELIQAKAEAYVNHRAEELQKKVDDGTATPAEKVTLLLMGLAGVMGAAGHIRKKPA